MNRVETIKSEIRWKMRSHLDNKNRARLSNKDFSLFSSNCTGGIIYHALGLPFLSPTVNIFFESEDYLKFLSNPQLYLNGGGDQACD